MFHCKNVSIGINIFEYLSQTIDETFSVELSAIANKHLNKQALS